MQNTTYDFEALCAGNFNILSARPFYIPYKCRCEAIGGNKRRGERYKSLNGAWNLKMTERSGKTPLYVYERCFDLPQAWKGLRIYVAAVPVCLPYCIYINDKLCASNNGSSFGEFEVTEFMKSGENKVTAVFDSEAESILPLLTLVARPARHIRSFGISATCCSDNSAFINVNAEIDCGSICKGSAKLTAELYDDELELVSSDETEVQCENSEQTAVVTVKTENAVIFSADNPYVYTLLLLFGGETLRQTVKLDCSQSCGCIFEEPKHEEPPFIEMPDKVSVEKAHDTLQISLIEPKGGVIAVKNISDEAVPENTELNYFLYNQRGLYGKGSVMLPLCQPNSERVIKLGYSLPEISPFEYFLEIESCCCRKLQFKLPVTQTVCERSYSDEMPEIYVTETTDGMLDIKGENFFYSFDLQNGSFTKLTMDGVNMPLCGASEYTCPSRLVSKTEKYAVISGAFDCGNGVCSVMWMIFGNGEISYSVSGIDDVCCGLNILSNDAFSSLCCFSSDSAENSYAGLYKLPVDDVNKINEARWALLCDEDGRGMLLKGIERFSVEKTGARLYRCTASAGGEKSDFFVFSLTVRPVFVDDEDIVREARTLPAAI